MKSTHRTAPAIPPGVTEIGAHASLRGIHLVRCRCKVVAVLPAGHGLPELKVDIRAGAERHKTLSSSLICGFGLDVTAVGPKPDSVAVARLSCDYAAHYDFAADDFFASSSDDDLAQFSAYNTSVHVWPHTRELMHSISM